MNTFSQPPAGDYRPASHDVLTCPEYDHEIRWEEGERLQHIFEQRCDWLRAHGHGDHVAVDAGGTVLTYDQLDARANQLARYVISRGARPGDRIGLLFDSPVHAYVGMLATLKVNAAYVPMDVGFPADRLSYIAQDANVRLVLTLSHLKDRLDQVESAVLNVDDLEATVATLESGRLSRVEAGEPVDELCYVIYTSGTTGRPKGVAIHHASICNFVRVAVEVYQMRWDDRVYQGMTIAFDFSVEEIWVPLATGATLVPKPRGANLLGPELWQFLHERSVTALCCVPTLLATLDDELPGLRFLLVSGEACPRDLVVRWHRADRRFLNVYGPTEATVTATWSAVHPDRPVTIGVPLPTYTVVILDPHENKTVARGVVGEIGIAGIGLAAGYLNRADLTDKAFIQDFVGIDGNRSGKIYRTGDLGRMTEDGEIEYQGRIDTQVKIRGYRIELSEIESVLLQAPGIAAAVVHTYEPMPGATELVAYYSPRADSGEVDRAALYRRLRDRLPAYMVPAYLEELPTLPMLPSGKADRKSLPRPMSSRSRSATREYVAGRTETERHLAILLGQALGVEQVSVNDHFFDDLGANSLLMARFCALTRKQQGLPSVAMQDVYLSPTVERLAVALSQTAAAAPEAMPATAPTEVTRISNWRYVLCGTVQFLIFLAYAYAITVVNVAGYRWVVNDGNWLSIYLRSLALGGGAFIGLSVIPIAAKWLLIGRWKEEQITVWTMKYVRFWAVRMLLRFNPLMLFAGSPLYVLYLRLLGARIGRHVVILTHHMPVCTDLLTIGAGTVIRKDSYLNCYRGRDGVIETGRVTLGANSFVGEASVLDIGTTLGAGSQLGHSSSLHAGQRVPDGERWHGTPAGPATVDYQRVGPAQCGTLRRAIYSFGQLAGAVFIYLPAVIILIRLLSTFLLTSPSQLTDPAFYVTQLLLAAVLFFGAIVAGLALVTTLPRLCSLLLKPDTTYRLYGFRYSLHKMVGRLTNRKLFMELFGDSSYVVYYLRALGYQLTPVQQTGSNFGAAVQHENPYLSTVGTGTMVSDGLSMLNAEYSSSSFRVSRARIGATNFLGNFVTFPAAARTGDNCLFASKVLVPLDGKVREGIGLLGSPSFEIPRSVERDSRFDHLTRGEAFRRSLFAKTRHNTGTIAAFLFARWLFVVGLTVLSQAGVGLAGRFGISSMAVAVVLGVIYTIWYFVLAERVAMGFRALRPQFCSIYEPYFWRHERLWKLNAMEVLEVCNGTPFKGIVWRALGVRIGRRVFDDGCSMPEKSLVRIGSHSMLNVGSCLQCHSLEDGTFKSGYITIGAGCTVGTMALVHYGVNMGDRSMLDADSFLMKGEEVAAWSRWRGNPAREVGSAEATLPQVALRSAAPLEASG